MSGPRPLPAAAGSPAPSPREVVEATVGDVWRLHAHLVGPAEADDLTQDTMLRVLRALPGFRGEASVRSWVLSIASRVAADEIRRRTRGRRLLRRLAVPAEVEPDPGSAHAVQALLATLDPARRAAFVLTQVLGYSYAETAEVLGVPIGTVRSRVARARADLLAALEG